VKITVLTLVSGNKWRCSQSGVCKQEQVIAYNKCPGIAILPGLVCPFSFSLPPLKILWDLFYFISYPCTLYCYWSITPGNWSPSLPGRKKQNSFRIFILFLISLQYKSSDYSNTDLGSFCRVQWKYDLSLGCLMCSEEHWKKDEDFLKTHHMSDTVLDTYHCIIHYLGIFTTSRKFQIIECWINVNVKNKTERLKIFMFSFIQGLSVPLFDSKETNSIIEDNSFSNLSWLSYSILTWFWFGCLCGFKKDVAILNVTSRHAQSKRKKSSIVLDKTLPQEPLASFLIEENCVTGLLLNQSLAGQVRTS